MYSQEEIAQMLDYYGDDNRKVAKEYLHEPGAELFCQSKANRRKEIRIYVSSFKTIAFKTPDRYIFFSHNGRKML